MKTFDQGAAVGNHRPLRQVNTYRHLFKLGGVRGAGGVGAISVLDGVVGAGGVAGFGVGDGVAAGGVVCRGCGGCVARDEGGEVRVVGGVGVCADVGWRGGLGAGGWGCWPWPWRDRLAYIF